MRRGVRRRIIRDKIEPNTYIRRMKVRLDLCHRHLPAQFCLNSAGPHETLLLKFLKSLSDRTFTTPRILYFYANLLVQHHPTISCLFFTRDRHQYASGQLIGNGNHSVSLKKSLAYVMSRWSKGKPGSYQTPLRTFLILIRSISWSPQVAQCSQITQNKSS